METILSKSNKSLSIALDCENEEDIIEGFIERYSVSKEEAKDIFEETKKWLWAASKSSEEDSLSMTIDSSLLIIDEMWHTFILHTKYYHDFCMNKLKKFIHHLPTPKGQKDSEQIRFENNPVAIIEERKAQTYNQLSFLYDNLGAETVIKWYEEYPTKYTPEYIRKIKK